MTSKREKSSRRKTTTPSSKKKGVVLARPDLDFTKSPEEQKEALDAFLDGFVEKLKKPG